MPICPSCHYEYEIEVRKCADCDEWLVDQLEGAAATPEPVPIAGELELVSVGVFESGLTAQMVADALSEDGIPTQFKTTSVSGTAAVGGIATAFGPVEVFVPRNHFAEAEAIVSRLTSDLGFPTGDGDGEDGDSDDDAEPEEEYA